MKKDIYASCPFYELWQKTKGLKDINNMSIKSFIKQRIKQRHTTSFEKNILSDLLVEMDNFTD